VSFTITGGDLTEPLEVVTDDNGILEFNLPASENAYTITEDISGASEDFFVDAGEFTVILVLNLVPEDEVGLVKVIKLYCESDEAGTVSFIVEGGDADVPLISGCDLGAEATFTLGDLEIVTPGDGDDQGIALVLVDVGEYTFAEIDPNEATYDGTVTVVEGEITTIVVLNTFTEDEQSGGGGGVTPGQSQTPRDGTAGGNPLPNTATTPAPGGSLPAILLALMALGALAVGGQRMAAEARRRR
jgi:hypothetical protein